MTIKQQQHLLGYLGYYNGQIDGQWGRMSTEACRAFQADYGLEPDGICGTISGFPEVRLEVLPVRLP